MKTIAQVLMGFVLLSLVFWLPDDLRAADATDEINKGIQAYQNEDFEDAIGILTAVRAENPENTLAAFFLGLAYKQTQEYADAEIHLRHAVSGEMRLKEALVELVFVLFRQQKPEKIEEALTWIELAEKEAIYPARIAFLKGQILQFQQRNPEAIAAFKTAKALDKSLTSAADFQIRLCEVQAKDPNQALACFRASIISLYDPRSDISTVKHPYRVLKDEAPGKKDFQFGLGIYGRYDTNVLLKPLESDFAAGISNEESPAAAVTLRSGYQPTTDGPWLVTLQHLLYGNFYEFHDDSHDYVGNTLYFAPGVKFGKFSLLMATTYNHVLLRSPEYAVYHESFRVGPLLRTTIGQGHFLEFFGGYETRKYYQDVTDPGNDRDARSVRSHIGWFWIPSRDSWLNLKYAYADDDTDGRYWDNSGHQVKCTVSFPVVKRLSLQLGVDGYFQKYKNKSPDPEFTDGFILIRETRREDQTYQGMAAITWELTPHFDLAAQYTHTIARSTHAAYDYRRDLYTAGIEWNF